MIRWLAVLLIGFSAGVTGPWLWRQAALRDAPPPQRELAYEPVELTVDTERLEDALAHAPWVSPGISPDAHDDDGGPIVWMIGHRACRGCDGFRRSAFGALYDAGVEARVIYFAPEDTSGPAERAVLAEIGVRRSWRVFESWLASSAGVYAVRNATLPAIDPIRSAVIVAGRRTRDDLRDVMAVNGYDVVYPLVLWQTPDGVWRATSGDSLNARSAVRDAFSLAGAAG